MSATSYSTPAAAQSSEVAPPGHQSQHGSVGGTELAPHLAHVMAVRTLLTVFATLVGLTIVTVLAAQVSMGEWEVWVSLGIATVKATLVAAYFMHLAYDKSFHGVVFVSSLVFVALFLAFTLMDIGGPTP